MTKLLLHTSSLVIKIKGKFDLPKDKNSKTVTIKKLIKLMQSESAQVEYLGYEFEKPYSGSEPIEDSVVIAMHVIEDPIAIDYDESTTEQVARFLKQIKKNTSRILLQDERTSNNQTENFYEFYVRGISDSSKNYRSLKQA